MATKSARMVPIATVREGTTHVMQRPASPLEFYRIRAEGMRRELAAAEARGMAHLREGTRLELEAMEVAIELAAAAEAFRDCLYPSEGWEPVEERFEAALARARGEVPNGL